MNRFGVHILAITTLALTWSVGATDADSQRALLGVNVTEAVHCENSTVAWARYEGGACVIEAIADSPGQSVGLQSGDVIVVLNGEAVASAVDLAATVRSANIGDSFRLLVIRGKEELILDGVYFDWQLNR